jgi:hypothetical protein
MMQIENENLLNVNSLGTFERKLIKWTTPPLPFWIN